MIKPFLSHFQVRQLFTSRPRCRGEYTTKWWKLWPHGSLVNPEIFPEFLKLAEPYSLFTSSVPRSTSSTFYTGFLVVLLLTILPLYPHHKKHMMSSTWDKGSVLVPSMPKHYLKFCFTFPWKKETFHPGICAQPGSVFTPDWAAVFGLWPFSLWPTVLKNSSQNIHRHQTSYLTNLTD